MPSIRKTALLLATTLSLAGTGFAAPAFAQDNAAAIGFGETVRGRIAPATESCTPLGPNVRSYTFTAAADDRIEVTLRAEDFDTVVQLGRMDGCRFVVMASNDDGGGEDDGLNSRLQGRLSAAGTYVLRATGLSEEAEGDYQLTLNRLPAPAAAPTPIAVEVGQRMRGTLTANDAIIADGSTSPLNFSLAALEAAASEDGESSDGPTLIMDSGRPYHFYSLTGEAGQEFEIKLDSDEFDPMLDVGVNSPLGFSIARSNDDGGGEDDGLNSRMKVKFDSAGTLILRVSPLSRDTGAYTLRVDPVRAP
ncbi:MAG: hypothetical protein MUF41_03955 [Sphingopyxis sp.]|nr:hypothetical protein [Sphingopyxis sp.]